MSVPRNLYRARWQTVTAALVVALGLTVNGCGSTDDPAGGAPATSVAEGAPPTVSEPTAPVATSAVTPTTASPTATSSTGVAPTTSPPTTSPPTTVTTPATTAVVPTTVALPQPIAPPLDAEAEEPVVELGRLAIPSLGLDATLYEGIRLPTFDLGPGHWPGSALPGQVGNMVVGGHRTSSNADFADLDELEAGDQMIATGNDGTPYTYAVDRVEITDPFAARIIGQTAAGTATLFACHPPGSVDYRIVVHLTLVA